MRVGWWQAGRGRAAAILASCVYLAVCLVPLFYGVLAFEARCGDVCGRGSGWEADADAWQWLPVGVLATGVFLAAVVLLGATMVGSGRVGGAAVVMTGLCWSGLGLLALTGT